MQTTASKQRFDLGRFKVAALVIGSAGALAIGAATYIGLQDDSPKTLPTVAGAGVQLHPDEAYRLEQEMLLRELYSPAGRESARDSFSDRRRIKGRPSAVTASEATMPATAASGFSDMDRAERIERLRAIGAEAIDSYDTMDRADWLARVHADKPARPGADEHPRHLIRTLSGDGDLLPPAGERGEHY